MSFNLNLSLRNMWKVPTLLFVFLLLLTICTGCSSTLGTLNTSSTSSSSSEIGIDDISALSVNELNGSTGVSVNSTFRYTFSRTVNIDTITTTSFFLVPIAGVDSSVNATLIKNLSYEAICNPNDRIDASIPYKSETSTILAPATPLNFNSDYGICLGGIRDSNDNSLENVTIQFRTEDRSLTAPSGVSLSTGDSQAIISWNEISGATSYNLYWATSPNVTKENGTRISGVSSPHSHTALTNGTTYYYIVTASDDSSESSISDEVSGTPSANISCSTPTCSDLHSAIYNSNSTGIRPLTAFSSVILPEFDCGADTPSYSLSDVPSFLTFTPANRTLALASGYEVPSSAIGSYSSTYTATVQEETFSISCVLNDMDGDTIVDHTEYQYGEVPLTDSLMGWFWLDPSTKSNYRPESTLPTAIGIASSGMNLNNANDASQDFDGDGISNLAEINLGTNIFVAESNGFLNFGRVEYAGISANGLISDDFNQDGNPDLATNNGEDTISILLGNGDGSLQEASNYNMSVTSSYSIDTGDFNGDSFPDIVVANTNDNLVNVFINDGDGTFQDGVGYTIDNDGYSGGVTTGDFNGDTYIDIAAVNYNSSTISILLGVGNGTFGPANNYSGPSNPCAITSGDFNGDSAIDLAVANRNNDNVTIMLNDGEGVFSAGQNYATGAGPHVILTEDLNNDDNLDLVVVTYHFPQYLSVLLGNGDGTFNTADNYDLGNIIYVTAGDFNEDNFTDLFVVGTTNQMMLNDGDGTFSEGQSFALNIWAPSQVISADFDKNGDIDVACYLDIDGGPTSIEPVMLLSGNGDGTIDLYSEYSVGENNPYYIVSADFNEDGNQDLVTILEMDSNIYMLLGAGDGSFGTATDIGDMTMEPLDVADIIVTADVNNDDHMDILAVNGSDENISLLLGDGTGSFTPSTISLDGSVYYVELHDFNEDGVLDMVATYLDTEIWEYMVTVLIGVGNGTFSENVSYSLGMEGGEPQVTVADYDGDLNLDFAVYYGSAPHEDKNIEIRFGAGDGTFSDATLYEALGAKIVDISSGDLDDDGDIDIVLLQNEMMTPPSTITIMLNNGSGSFAAHETTYDFRDNAGAILIYDANGDNILDLTASTYSSMGHDINIYLGNGDATFASPTKYLTWPSYGIPALGDYDNDGDLDLALGTANTSIMIYLNE